jgi:two-component system, chemotaxis family, protein-glutamate methylesterase/glutaminase
MIKVFIIDDSALVRAFLNEILSRDKDIEVVGQTVDAYFAMDKIKKLEPDIITLDIQMPRMNGLDFLQQLMAEYPTPVIMFSSLTQDGSDITLKALELGALDYVAKPQENLTKNLYQVKDEILTKVKSLSQIKIKEILSKRPELIINRDNIKTLKGKSTDIKESTRPTRFKTTDKKRKSDKVILIGASTGGTRAISELLPLLPEDTPPIVIVQHMPPIFTTRFAEDMNNRCQMTVSEAKDGDVLESGKVFVAPGGYHTMIKTQGLSHILNVVSGPPVNHHKPSVDVLFRSASKALRDRVIGIMLTGMGNDGAVGMKEMKQTGAYNIAQNKDTCVVYGMPKEAIEVKAVDVVLPLQDIASHMLKRIGFLD